MKNLSRLLFLLVIAALCFWAWTIFFPNPRRAVQQRLDKIARLASFPPGEGNFSRVYAIQKIGRLFAEDVQVIVELPGYEKIIFNGRAELLQALALSKQLGQGVHAEFLDMNIEIGSDNTSALVDLTLKAKVGGENDLIVQEFNFTLKKIKGDWLVTHVESVKTLKP